MKILHLSALCSLLVISISPLSLQAQDETMMKAWTAYLTPGDMHKMMAAYDGSWKAEITMWMEPGAAPVKSTGNSVSKMILGGRYQETHYEGQFMDKPMQGYSLLGYDNSKKVFESTWVDNMGTGIMVLSGSYDPKTRSITFTGKQRDPMMGKDVNIREILTFTDENNQQMDMYMTYEGLPEFKTMEIRYKKK